MFHHTGWLLLNPGRRREDGLHHPEWTIQVSGDAVWLNECPGRFSAIDAAGAPVPILSTDPGKRMQEPMPFAKSN